MRIFKLIPGAIFILSCFMLPAQETGLVVEAYQLPGPVTGVPDLVPGQQPSAIFPIEDVNLEGNRAFRAFQQHFFYRIHGEFKLAETDTYRFRLIADDWARIKINQSWLADTDDETKGLPQTREFEVALEEGLHEVEIWYYNGDPTKRLKWEWYIKGIQSFVPVPEEILEHKKQAYAAFKPGLARLYSAQARSIPGDQQVLADLHPALEQKNALPQSWEAGISGLLPVDDGLMVSSWAKDGCLYHWSSTQDSSIKIWQGLDLPTSFGKLDEGYWVLQQNELTRLQDSDGDDQLDQFTIMALIPLKKGERATQALKVDQEYFIAVEGAGNSRLFRLKQDKTLSQIKSWPGRGLHMTPAGVDKHLLMHHQGPDQWTSLKHIHTQTLTETTLAFIPPSLMAYPGGILALSQGPYKGDILIGDQGQGGLRRLHIEENGNLSILRFSQGLNTVPALLAETAEGFFVGGQQLPGLTEAPGTLDFGMDEMSWKEGQAMEIQFLRPVKNGVWVTFNQALHPNQSLLPTDIDLLNFGVNGQAGNPLKIEHIHLAVDNPATLFLQTSELSPNQLLYLHLKKGIFSQQDAPLRSSEAWCSVEGTLGPGESIDNPFPIPAAPNTLSAQELAAGWKLLFDGQTTAGWRNPHQAGIHPGWQAEAGALVRAGDGAGDIISIDQYEAFELRLEWKIAAGGNSGVFFHVGEGESGQPIYVTGPEMQILDDLVHPDRRYHSHRAGSNYDLHPAAFEALNPVGNWNEARLIVRPDGKVEHWLNGYLIVSYTLGDEDWLQRLKASKFASMPEYGRLKKGHLGLQDHGDKVSFRNIKILPF